MIAAPANRAYAKQATIGRPALRRWLLPVALGIVLAVTVLFAIAGIGMPGWDAIADLGYPGLFLLNLFGNATVVVPVPTLLAVITASAVLSPVLVVLLSGLGMAVGGLIVFYGGRVAGERFTTGGDGFARRAVERHGFLAVLALSAVPNPVYGVAAVTAGALGMGGMRFFLATLAGQLLKCAAIVVAVTLSLSLLPRPF